MNQLELFTGAQLRDKGIKLASDNAGQEWNDKALDCLIMYLGIINNNKFTCEDFRQWISEDLLPPPPHLRAYGAVIVKAKKLKLIKHVGYATCNTPRVHSAISSLWSKI